MLMKTLSVENTKNLKRSMLWIELGILAVMIILLNLGIYVITEFSLDGAGIDTDAREMFVQSLTWPSSLINMLGFSAGGAFGGLLVIIFVSAVTAQEYTWRTMHLWISQGAQRPMLMLAKFASLFLPLLLIVLTPLVVGGLITVWFSLQFNGSLNLDQLVLWQLVLSILRTTYALLPYAALTFFFAVIGRSTVLAIGAGLGYSLLVEGILTQVMTLLGGSYSRIGMYLPGGLGRSLMSLNEMAVVGYGSLTVNGAQAEMLSPANAAMMIAVWTLALFGLAVWVFQRQDLGG